MKKWLADDGLSEDPGHSMDGMGGMLSDDELVDLGNSTGSEFDRKFLAGMIEHHLGAVEMVKMLNRTQVTELKIFGEQIVKTQTSEIELMRSLLSKI
jgi:uncharacterized protein (DUF305 family)